MNGLETAMKMHLVYLQYVLRHKWFVFVECCKLGIPWLGIIHDMGRLGLSEWFAYVASAPYNRENKPPGITKNFNRAWNHHQHRNKHHWEYWVCFDYHDHSMHPIEMPDRYRCEMLADWRGAARAQGFIKGDTIDWYMINRDKIILHPDTRQWLERNLTIVECGVEKTRK